MHDLGFTDEPIFPQNYALAVSQLLDVAATVISMFGEDEPEASEFEQSLERSRMPIPVGSTE